MAEPAPPPEAPSWEEVTRSRESEEKRLIDATLPAPSR